MTIATATDKVNLICGLNLSFEHFESARNKISQISRPIIVDSESMKKYMLDMRETYQAVFQQLLTSIDLIKDYDNKFWDKSFESKVVLAFQTLDFDGNNNYKYFRELRNGIMHRGENIAWRIDFGMNTPVLPKEVYDLKGKSVYKRFIPIANFFAYFLEMKIKPLIESQIDLMGIWSTVEHLDDEAVLQARAWKSMFKELRATLKTLPSTEDVLNKHLNDLKTLWVPPLYKD